MNLGLQKIKKGLCQSPDFYASSRMPFIVDDIGLNATSRRRTYACDRMYNRPAQVIRSQRRLASKEIAVWWSTQALGSSILSAHQGAIIFLARIACL